MTPAKPCPQVPKDGTLRGVTVNVSFQDVARQHVELPRDGYGVEAAARGKTDLCRTDRDREINQILHSRRFPSYVFGLDPANPPLEHFRI